MIIKCSFCRKTADAPLWPEGKPEGWELMPDGIIVCPSPEHRGGVDKDVTIPGPSR